MTPTPHMRQRIHVAMAVRGMTQRDVAYAARIGNGHMSSCLRGVRQFSVPVLGRVAECLGVSVSWILEDSPVLVAGISRWGHLLPSDASLHSTP